MPCLHKLFINNLKMFSKSSHIIVCSHVVEALPLLLSKTFARVGNIAVGCRDVL